MRGALWGLLAGEAGLVVVGLGWAWLRGIDLPFGFTLKLLLAAAVVAGGLSAINLSLYRRLRRRWPSSRVSVFLEQDVFPLFRGASTGELALLAAVAGLGEEIFFRGVLQREIGLLAASLLFGLAHGPTRSLIGLAAWAFLMGLSLGWLYRWSGSLTVPVLVHALYDMAALAYVRRLPPAEADPATHEGETR